MENRLKLNKRPTYELPGDVLIGKTSKDKIPSFEPNICLNYYGRLKIREKLKTTYQIWIKTNDTNLINFIKSYDWEKKIKKTKEGSNMYKLSVWKFKKIILEEFYEVKHGE